MAIEQKKVEQRTEPERHILGRPVIYQVGTWGMGYLPKRLSYWFARRIADISYLFYKKARLNVKNNLRKVFPQLTGSEISSLALSTFRNYSTYLVDYGRFRLLERDSLAGIISIKEGKENLDLALERNKGLIIVTAHLGNWELGAIFFGRQGMKINVVTFRDGIDRIDELRESYRRHHNINTVILGDSPFATIELLNALQKNEIVAMLVDRYNGKEDSIDVDFFGRPLKFPKGPLVLAKMTGAAIVPAFVVRNDMAYHAIFGKPAIVNDGDMLEKHAQEIIGIFEDCIKRYPDQWYNFVEI